MMSESTRTNGANGNGHTHHSAELKEALRRGREDLDGDWTVPAKFLNDPEIWEAEKTRVFGRTWVFLAHESEIPEPGDYVVRPIVDDQFIVTRDEKGEIRAHFNACRHRGMQVCRAEMGNASHYRCPYHGWTYNNRGQLVGVPAGKEAYGNKLKKSDWSLLALPQLDSYKGLIFGNLDPEAPSLDEYLGDMKFYIDLFADRSDAGLQVMGAPQRWIVDANWKLGSDNFVGDAYHTMMTHRSMVELGLAPPDPQFALYGEHVHCNNGHGLGIIGPPPGIPLPEFLGLPENIIESLKRRLTPEQVEVLTPAAFIHGTVFPNLSVGNFLMSKDHQSPPSSHLTLRVWHPIAADKMEVWSYFLVEKDAPEEWKRESYLIYNHTFGSSGAFEQDDAENWRSITRVLRGEMGRRLDLNYQMGRGMLEPDTNWPGPGEAFPMDYAEANQRNFHDYWMELMTTDPPAQNPADGNGHGETAAGVTPTGAGATS
jgi:phenylpropionate dioxygenase-like ring-hydroxylating dioxygenase large terminal subunit